MSSSFENQLDNQAVRFFATTFARLLADSLQGTTGVTCCIEIADPQADPVPVLIEPVHFCLTFEGGLAGACYAVVGQTHVEALAGGRAGAKDHASAFLSCLEAVSSTLPDQFKEAHGPVSLRVAAAPACAPTAVEAIELCAKDEKGEASAILLYLEPQLLQGLRSARGQGTVVQGAVQGVAQGAAQANLELVMDVELSVTLRFGQRTLSLREILDLASGSVVELDRQVDEPVELMLDGKVIARGEAVIIDGNYGLRVTQVLQPVVY